VSVKYWYVSMSGGSLNNERLNLDMHNYMKGMSNNHRCCLQGAACKVDESHAFSNFCEEYANANDANMAQKQAVRIRGRGIPMNG
jgi:hypothetical protein